MKKLAHYSGHYLLIVIISIFIQACKTSKKTVNSADQNDLSVKFEKLYIEACTQYNIGNFTVALAQFNKCSDIKPEEASVYFQISRIKQNLNENNAAFQNASRANTLDPANKFYAYHYVRMLRVNGDYIKATEVLKACINFNPKDENLFIQLDEIYSIQKETSKQIELWNQYKNTVGLKNRTGIKLIELYKRNNDFTNAHRIFDELKKGAPNKAQLYIDDAKLYESQKDEVNAMINYEKAMILSPNNWEINYALYQFYCTKNDTDKASKYLNAAFHNSTTSFETQLPACLAILKSIDSDTANCKYAKIAAIGMADAFSRNAKALYTSGELFYACGNYELAFNNFNLAYELDPNLFDAWKGAIDCGFKLNKVDQSIAIAGKAIEFFPNTVLLYEKLSEAYILKKQFEKAIEASSLGEKFSFDDETKSRLLFQKANGYFLLAKYSEAKLIIEEALVINKSSGALYDLLGNIFFKQSNIDKAIENWQLANDLGYKIELTKKKISDKTLYE